MQAARIDALIATAYNLHIQKGEAMTPAKAAKLPRGGLFPRVFERLLRWLGLR